MIAESIGIAALALSGMTGSPENVASDKKDSFGSESQIVLSSKENTPTPMLRGWWDDSVHATATAALKAAGKVPPELEFVFDNLTGCYPHWMVQTIQNTSNYKWNSTRTPVFTKSSDFPFDSVCITAQQNDEYSNWRFDSTNLKKVGCEVIAGYNLQRKMGFNLTLAEVASTYEVMGIQIGTAQVGGNFGCNPCQIWYFLDTLNIDYIKIENYSDFEALFNDDNEYHFILSSWNDWPWDSPLHTFYEEKICVRKTKQKYLRTFNKSSSDYVEIAQGPYDALSCPSQRNNQLFVYGYAVKK